MRRVLQELDSLEDLFALAVVNRAAYLAFKSDELCLIKATLRKTSPPAWELRQVSEVHWDTEHLPGGLSLATTLYLRHYTRGLCHLTAMKFLLQDHCESHLRDETVAGLGDPYSARGDEIDAALWRIWTFCQLFGNQKEREQDLCGQVQWLRGQALSTDLPPVCHTTPDPMDFNTVLFVPPEGYAQGNAGGLSAKQLLDMLELWTAMAVLLDFLREETDRARRFGVFDRTDIAPGNLQQEKQVLRRFQPTESLL
jgi:hypothetical protein